MRIEARRERKIPAYSGGPARRAAPQKAFVETLRDAGDEQRRDALDQLLLAVDKAGRELRRDPSLAALRQYKESVRAFVREALRLMYAVDERLGFDRRGNPTFALIVRTIDEKLEELTRQCLESQKGTIDLAARLDEIRGLLLDLYS